MSLFSWLLIGHLVGDWLLQNDWMARGKKEAFFTLPGLAHYTIYTLTIMVMLGISLKLYQSPLTFWSLSGFVFITHWIIDATDIVERWIRFYKQSYSTMMRVMVDQTFHLITLVLIVYLVPSL